jgi:hypothetical protein
MFNNKANIVLGIIFTVGTIGFAALMILVYHQRETMWDDRVMEHITYTKDESTGLCFANHYVGRSMVLVPCTPAVEAQIKK